MFEMSSDDLFLPAFQDEELVDRLLCSEDADEDGGRGGLTLAEALLPLVEPPSSTCGPWFSSTRYKTELCTTYSATGICKYAERCQFAHGLRELRVPFRHPKYKTELCRSFHATGYCYYGNRCLFVHSPAEQRQPLRRRRNVPCRTFRSFGVCPFGSRCNFLHVGEAEGESGGEAGGEEDSGCKKTPPVPAAQTHPPAKEWRPRGALCRTFSSFGFCLYGTCCRFQHGLPNKMKPSDQDQGANLSPQLSSIFPALPFSAWSNTSTSSSPSTSPLDTPSSEDSGRDAFSFSSQQLSGLLLPLALHLESSKAQDIWESRAL